MKARHGFDFEVGGEKRQGCSHAGCFMVIGLLAGVGGIITLVVSFFI